MARIPVFVNVADPATGNAITGVVATVTNRASGAAVPLYTTEAGATRAEPLTTDGSGRANAWAEEQPLAIAYSGGGVVPYTEYRDALPTFVTALPANAVDGQECYFVADAANGVVWRLKYRAADTSSYKWNFAGGPPLTDEVLNFESTSSTAFASLTTAGPTITVPVAGDYIVEIGASAYANAVVGDAVMSYAIGATAATENDRVLIGASTTFSQSGSRARRKTGLAANTALAAQYKGQAGAVTFLDRWMRVAPVRVG